MSEITCMHKEQAKDEYKVCWVCAYCDGGQHSYADRDDIETNSLEVTCMYCGREWERKVKDFWYDEGTTEDH